MKAHIVTDLHGTVLFSSNSPAEASDWANTHDPLAEWSNLISLTGSALELELCLWAADSLQRMPA